jgi:hypothetical protein
MKKMHVSIKIKKLLLHLKLFIRNYKFVIWNFCNFELWNFELCTPSRKKVTKRGNPISTSKCNGWTGRLN